MQRPTPSVRPFSVLIVDSQADAEGVAGTLRSAGLLACVALYEADAEHALREILFDAVLIGLPGHEGGRLARSLRKLTRGKTLLIAVERMGMAVGQGPSARVEFDHQLANPVSTGELTRLLTHFPRRHEAGRQTA